MKSITLILLLFICTKTPAQNLDTIYWRANYNLKYKDFQGRPDSTKIDWANSRIGILYNYEVSNGNIVYSTNAYFLKKISWAKNDLQVLLDHEQDHFNIAKYFSLKLLDSLEKSQFPITNLDKNMLSVYYFVAQQRLKVDNYLDKLEHDNPNTDVPQLEFSKYIKQQIYLLQNKLKRHR